MLIKIVVILLLSSVTTNSVKAQTEDSESSFDPAKERARGHFRTGVNFYRERNFRAALIEFQRAYKTYPNYKLLYNLGQASLDLQEYVQAIDYLTSYLRAGDHLIEVQRRDEVRRTIAELESRVATLIVTSNEKGATVYVDDIAIGAIPMNSPIRISSGRRKVSVSKEGMLPVQRIVDVAAGEERSVRLEFAKPDETQADEVSPGRSNLPMIIAAIGTGAFAVATGAMAIVSVAAENAYQKERETETTKADLKNLRDDAKSKALVTDILLGATVASGVITAILIFTQQGEEPPVNDGNLSVDLALAPNSAGVVIGNRF